MAPFYSPQLLSPSSTTSYTLLQTVPGASAYAITGVPVIQLLSNPSTPNTLYPMITFGILTVTIGISSFVISIMKYREDAASTSGETTHTGDGSMVDTSDSPLPRVVEETNAEDGHELQSVRRSDTADTTTTIVHQTIEIHEDA